MDRTGLDLTVVPGAVSVGAADLQGTSVELESSGDLGISPTATLTATSLALGAPSVTFAADAAGLSGLVITPALQAPSSAALQQAGPFKARAWLNFQGGSTAAISHLDTCPRPRPTATAAS